MPKKSIIVFVIYNLQKILLGWPDGGFDADGGYCKAVRHQLLTSGSFRSQSHHVIWRYIVWDTDNVVK
jgi:hypothetical protein